MRLSPHDQTAYRERGYLCVPGLFDDAEVERLRDGFDADARGPGPHRIVEDAGAEVRAVYASHRRLPVFADLVRSPRLLEPARALLGTEVYVYQFKINSKAALSGDGFSWHQDFRAWQLEDGLPSPRLVNVALFLDDVTEFNGPIVFAEGSHADASAAGPAPVTPAGGGHLDPRDICLERDELADLVRRHPLVGPKGPAGTVVFFHPQVVHGSGTNISPHARRVAIITYNDVANPPRPAGEPRPEYLVGRDRTPLAPLVAEGAL